MSAIKLSELQTYLSCLQGIAWQHVRAKAWRGNHIHGPLWQSCWAPLGKVACHDLQSVVNALNELRNPSEVATDDVFTAPNIALFGIAHQVESPAELSDNPGEMYTLLERSLDILASGYVPFQLYLYAHGAFKDLQLEPSERPKRIFEWVHEHYRIDHHSERTAGTLQEFVCGRIIADLPDNADYPTHAITYDLHQRVFWRSMEWRWLGIRDRWAADVAAYEAQFPDDRQGLVTLIAEKPLRRSHHCLLSLLQHSHRLHSRENIEQNPELIEAFHDLCGRIQEIVTENQYVKV